MIRLTEIMNLYMEFFMMIYYVFVKYQNIDLSVAKNLM